MSSMTTTDLDLVPAPARRAPASIDPDEMARMLFQARGWMHDTGQVPSRNRLMDQLHVGPDKANAVRAVLLSDNPAMPQSGGGYDGIEPTGAWPLVTTAPSPVAEVDTAPAPKRIRRPRSWPLFLLALPAFVAVWSGWVGLGELAGFGVIHPLPGIADRVSLNTAITLPIGVETYAMFAIRVWLSPVVSGRTRSFARLSAAGSLGLGVLGQVAYHLMSAWKVAVAPWPIVTAVGAIPIVVVAAGGALAHMLSADRAAELADQQ